MRRNYPLGIALRQDRDAPLTGQFQRLNRIIPEDQELVCLQANTRVRDALETLKKKSFSQLPVIHEGEIIGVFSYRSFSLLTLDFNDPRTSVLDLTVGDFVEELPFRSLDDPFEDAIEDLDRVDAVLVGTPVKPSAIVSSMDVLRFLYGAASPFVLIGEIELAIRALLSWSATMSQLQECFKRSLSSVYKENEVPGRVEELSFSDYVNVIGHSDNWEQYFKNSFGSSRGNVRSRLGELINIRNDMLHFRREITVAEFEKLTDVRDWLLRRSKMVQHPVVQTRLEVA